MYKELLKIGEEPIKIIVLLANQFRLMYQSKLLTSKGYSEDDIASLLHVKRYPVHLAIQKSYHLPIFKGYKAINKSGVFKLIDELYTNLPTDVLKAREYLKSRNYDLQQNRGETNVYDVIKNFEFYLYDLNLFFE